MTLGWIYNLFVIALGIALLFSRRYTHLKLIYLYVFGTLALSLTYKLLFFNWYFYLFSIMGKAFLLALAYWEVTKKEEGKSLRILLLAAGAVLVVPLTPLPIVKQVVLPYLLIDIVIAAHLPFALRSKNPLLIVWSVFAPFDAALHILKLLPIQKYQVIQVMISLDAWPIILTFAGLTAVVLWQPAMKLLRRGTQQASLPSEPKLSLISGKAESTSTSLAKVHDIRDFAPLPHATSEVPEFEAIKDEVDSLSPVLSDAARMYTLNHKPYLTPEEAMFYLGMNEEELEDFITRYGIPKLYLTGKKEKWVVRRESVESIH